MPGNEGEKVLALECFTFTVTESEAAAISLFLTDNKCEPNSQGLKKFLLIHSGVEKNEEEIAQDEGLSRGVARLTEALQRHPEVADALKKEGARIVGSLMRRIFTS
jgi:hypothetical protein